MLPEESVDVLVVGWARECGPRLKVTCSRAIWRRADSEKPVHMPKNWVQL